jgi:hypothetical protein
LSYSNISPTVTATDNIVVTTDTGAVPAYPKRFYSVLRTGTSSYDSTGY